MSEGLSQNPEDIFRQYNEDEEATRRAYEASLVAKSFLTKAVSKGVLAYRRMRLSQSESELEMQLLSSRELH